MRGPISSTHCGGTRAPRTGYFIPVCDGLAVCDRLIHINVKKILTRRSWGIY